MSHYHHHYPEHEGFDLIVDRYDRERDRLKDERAEKAFADLCAMCVKADKSCPVWFPGCQTTKCVEHKEAE